VDKLLLLKLFCNHLSQLFITGVLLQVCDSELFCFLFILFIFGNHTHTCMMTDCVAFSTNFLSKVKYFFILTQSFLVDYTPFSQYLY
jgi:hypothetical protein